MIQDQVRKWLMVNRQWVQRDGDSQDLINSKTGQGGATQCVCTWIRMWLREKHLGKTLIPFLGNQHKCVALQMACTPKHGEQARGIRGLLCSFRAMVSSRLQRSGGIARITVLQSMEAQGRIARTDSKPFLRESRICRELCLEVGNEPAESW